MINSNIKYSPIRHKLFNKDNSINLFELDNIISQNKLQKNIVKFYFIVIIFLLLIILYALILQ